MLGQHWRQWPNIITMLGLAWQGSVVWLSYPTNTRHWPNAGLMLAHGLWCWPNVRPALGQCFVCWDTIQAHITLYHYTQLYNIQSNQYTLSSSDDIICTKISTSFRPAIKHYKEEVCQARIIYWENIPQLRYNGARTEKSLLSISHLIYILDAMGCYILQPLSCYNCIHSLNYKLNYRNVAIVTV